ISPGCNKQCRKRHLQHLLLVGNPRRSHARKTLKTFPLHTFPQHALPQDAPALSDNSARLCHSSLSTPLPPLHSTPSSPLLSSPPSGPAHCLPLPLLLRS